MAVPQVAGAAALLKAFRPAALHKQTKDALMASVDRTPFFRGKCVSGGRLNVSGSLSTLNTLM